MLFWLSFLMFYFSYLFSVLFLGFLVMIMCLCYFSSVFFFKFLIVLVYLSGIVVFILYISCLCWFVSEKFSMFFLMFGFLMVYLYDTGLWLKLGSFGEYLWMFLFFSFLFNSLVMNYSLMLFKNSGSLRF